LERCEDGQWPDLPPTMQDLTRKESMLALSLFVVSKIEGKFHLKTDKEQPQSYFNEV
jgi:hypothetical protein